MPSLFELRNSVESKLGLDGTSGSSDDTLVIQWLNEGVREVLLRTHCRIEIGEADLTADEWTYDLPTTIMAIHQVVTEDNTPVEVVQFREILDLRRNESDSTPADLRMAVMGSNLFSVWPTPSEASTLTFFYVPRPTEMTSDAHDPSDSTYGGIPLEYHHAIELWALSQGSDYEHEQQTDRGIKYLAQFDEHLKRVIRPAVNRMGGSLPRARVGRGRSPRIDNGRYPRI